MNAVKLITPTRLVLLTVMLCASTSIFGLEPPHPTPALEPIQVVEIQLQGLQHNDKPHPDTGITQTWAFAHPLNRARTGPLDRFIAMLKSQHYRALLNHRDHQVEPVQSNDRVAVFRVLVQTRDNRLLDYEWILEKVEGGRFDGCWMTTGVSPPESLGSAI